MKSPLTSHPTIESILLAHQTQLGADYTKYRNHLYRVFNLAVTLSNPDEENYKALAIAAAFHDIGIWTANTFDYLDPSVELAGIYLKLNGLLHLEEPVASIINNHHKLSTYKSNNIVEAFRKADLIDLSFGLFKFGIETKQLAELNTLFPSLGFHRFIVKQALKNTLLHPVNPLPMMRM
jgi:hypothetical protein